MKSLPISGDLLPTPTTLDAKARDYYSKGDWALGGVAKNVYLLFATTVLGAKNVTG